MAGRMSLLVAAALFAAGCTGSANNENRGEGLTTSQDALQASVDPGDPVLPPADGFVGSGHCIGCHGGLYTSYEKTSHARGLRTAGRPGVSGMPVTADSDGDGLDDFAEGLDLSTLPAFAAFGADAPRLSRGGPSGPWRFTVGAVTYEVVRVYGGSRREDYLLRLGRSLYPAPAEYDVEARTWIPLETETWYAGTTPRFGSAAAAAASIDRDTSFERRCAGCHAGGFTVGYDAPSGEWLTGYTETGIGCEACHGPGRDHVSSGGDKSKIVNPRGLIAAFVDGEKRAEDACARCHTKGGGGTVPGAPSPVLYAWSAPLGRAFLPGDDLADFLTPTSDSADFRGYKDNYLSPVPTPGDPSDDSFIAARGAYLQGHEQANGAHPSSKAGTARCFDCHAAHGSAAPSMLVETAPRQPTVRTSAEDGTVCLACHAGAPPFDDIETADAAAFAEGGPSGVPASVVAHMADIGMPVAESAFDPRGTGVGRCDTCHMPPTVEERRGSGVDAGGRPTGGAGGGTHGMLAIWPSASARHGMTNSCSGCHPSGLSDGVGAILDQWAEGDPDGDGRMHGYTPRGEHLGELNPGSGAGLRCAQCHTTEGFRGIVVEGDADGLSTDDARLAAIVSRAARMDEGITCAACHGRDGSGGFAAGNAPLRIPRATLCSSCHFSGGIDFQDYTTLGEPVHFPQEELMEGTAGEEPPGSGFYESTDHAFFADRCAKCHFDTATVGVKPTHTFQPQLGTCKVCHPSATSLDMPTAADWDGDGVKEGIQSEVSGLLTILRTAILTGDAAVTFDGSGFRRNGVPGLPGASVARQRAAYNWEVVSKDGSRGVHNGGRIVKLLQQSYKELTGNNVPGAVMR